MCELPAEMFSQQRADKHMNWIYVLGCKRESLRIESVGNGKRNDPNVRIG